MRQAPILKNFLLKHNMDNFYRVCLAVATKDVNAAATS